jgi:hypothetical protein
MLPVSIVTVSAHRTVALLVAALLLLAQGLFGPGSTLRADPLGSIPICHADPSGEANPDPAQPAGHSGDCTLCVVCHALAGPAVLPAPAMPPFAAEVVRPVRSVLPPSRAPPAAPRLAATYPTGPPRLT